MQLSESRKIKQLVFIISIVLVASNLRAPITSVGPVVPELQKAFNLSNTAAGLITTIPLLAFAFLSPIAPGLANKYHIRLIIWFAVVSIVFGLLFRVSGSWLPLYIGTAFIGAGIAMCNVLMPPLIKQEFPNHIGLLTGIYSVAMNITASFASGLSIAIGQWSGYGWKGSLGFWLIFAILAILVWTTQLKGIGQSKQISSSAESKKTSFIKQPKAWQVTCFMGIQSLLFYCAVAWLPVVLQEWGMSSEQSGWSLSFIQFSQLPIMFVGPILIARMKQHTTLLIGIGSTLIISILLILLFKTTYIVPAAILYGIGTGLAFSLVMMWFVLRTGSTVNAARLSGMAQSFGYFIAAIAPPLFGLVHDITSSWTLPFAGLGIMVIFLILSGYQVSKPGYIDN